MSETNRCHSSLPVSALHPDGKFAYLITETTATIGTYAVDPVSGTRPHQDEPDPQPLPEPDAACGQLNAAVEALSVMLTGTRLEDDLADFFAANRWWRKRHEVIFVQRAGGARRQYLQKMRRNHRRP
jgi:hypothetical protein